jgi:uncharacterized protein (DUF952 family)
VAGDECSATGLRIPVDRGFCKVPMPATIYKILSADDWREAQRQGVYRGSAHDRRDGFIHFSTAEQTPGTYEKYFSGQHDLILVAIDADALDAALKWEPSRGGALFPHLYGDLPLAAVRWSRPLNSIADVRQLGQ